MKKILVAAAVLTFCLAIMAQFAIANPDSSAISGKVLETMNSGSYTYIRIDYNGDEVWGAVPETKVEVGETVTFAPGMWMVNFKSKTLNRTFYRIYFSGGIIK